MGGSIIMETNKQQTTLVLYGTPYSHWNTRQWEEHICPHRKGSSALCWLQLCSPKTRFCIFSAGFFLPDYPPSIFSTSLAMLTFPNSHLQKNCNPQHLNRTAFSWWTVKCTWGQFLLMEYYFIHNKHALMWGNKTSSPKQEQRRHLGSILSHEYGKQASVCKWAIYY